MSLSLDPTFTELTSDFVCGTRDITGAPWAGKSGIHPIEGGAVFTTNGAGPHNVQMFVLAPDGTVLTALPGYWNSEDLALELDFAKKLYQVWIDPNLSLETKRFKFVQMHMQHIVDHPAAMVRRSQMQGFDKKFEAKNRPNSDTILAKTGGDPKFGGFQFKTTDVIMHERMAAQPFVNYRDFNVVAFSDYGRPKYDKKEEGELAPPPTMKKAKRHRGG